MSSTDRWDELQDQADLLALEIASQKITARQQALNPEPEGEWDNEKVSRERRAKWQAVDDRQRASRALTKKIREIYSDQGRRSA